MSDSINCTIEQLDLIRRLIRGTEDSVAFLAAKQVLVDNKSRKEAQEILGATAHAVASGDRRYRAIYKEIIEVF